jgi:hypothetical protein
MVSACAVFDKPTLDFYGNVSKDYFDGENWQKLIIATKLYGVKEDLLVWWYWSEEGWAAFQDEFNNLQEPTRFTRYDGNGCPQDVDK